ncbi:MAG: metallophosphoesterase family protein [Candidatus Hydrogenedentes bacterium]|nr:metallophosphoesterase family protein [Candidatus Hydrogenedentota bacterium]
MLVAVLGGAAGNVAALDSALAEIDDRGIHTVLCTGNLAVGDSDGNRVIERLRERRVTCVQGEFDRFVVRALRKADSLRKRLTEAAFEAIVCAHESLASENVEYLRALPHRLTLSFEGKTICLCHGSVTSQGNALHADDSLEVFRRQREAANCDVIVCGSDVEAFVREIDTTLFVNPGRVDAVMGRAAFAVIDTDGVPAIGELVRVGC